MLRHKNLWRIMLSSALWVLTRIRPFLSRWITFTAAEAINGTIGDWLLASTDAGTKNKKADIFLFVRRSDGVESQVSKTARGFSSTFGMKGFVRPFNLHICNWIVSTWIDEFMFAQFSNDSESFFDYMLAVHVWNIFWQTFLMSSLFLNMLALLEKIHFSTLSPAKLN